jgi:hypothetical protein
VTTDTEPLSHRILLSVIALAIVFVLSWLGLRPPSPVAVDEPANHFSAARARETLVRIIGNEAPHPTGSDKNNAVRDQILREFMRIGYQTDVQIAFNCNEFGTCATVNNILARLEGRERSAVLLAAHYDSVPAGPGVSDDAAGVATALEIARALKHLPNPRHSIIFLIDDGEEAGLIGARAFVESHPWARDVRAALNVDARGTSGPSLMFETGAANAWAVQLYARNVHHPAASSIFYTVYKQLPNDTDFTLFRAAGYQGLNFAFIGDVAQYHTPLDNLANLDPASLQHQGDNALPSLLALASADFSRIPQSEAIYFDLFGRRTVRFSPRWIIAIAIITALLIGAEIALLFRRLRLARRQFALGLAAWGATIAAAAVLGLVLQRFMQIGGAIPVNWIAHPFPVEFAFWCLAISVVITIAVLFAPACGFWGLWAGVWAWWALSCVVTAGLTKGVSYVFVIPSAIAAIAAAPGALGKDRRLNEIFGAWAVVLPLSASGVVGFPIALLLYDGLGNRALPAIAALLAVIFTPILPLCVDFVRIKSVRGVAFFWIPAALTFGSAFAAVLIPAYSSKAPERVNIEYWKDADTGKSQWIVLPDSGKLPEPIRLAASFEPATKGPFPWDAGPVFLAPASNLNNPAPTLTILESTPQEGQRSYRALLRSERGAPVVMALFPPAAAPAAPTVTEVRMNGRSAETVPGRRADSYGGWKVYRCLTTPPEGVEIAFTLPSGGPLEIFAADASYGLPVEGRFLLSARPPTAAPSQNGDVTIVSRRVDLIP